MKTSAASLILLLFAATHSYAALKADLSSFRKNVLPLLSKYCMDCHDADTKKGSFDLENLAPNMLSDGYAKLAPVGSLQPNNWGLHDMLGNVAEWTDDAVMRGGSWLSTPWNCRCAHRQKMGDRDQRNYLGIRVVIRKISTATPKKQ